MLVECDAMRGVAHVHRKVQVAYCTTTSIVGGGISACMRNPGSDYDGGGRLL